MIRRHSLPAQVYALVERTPATVLLEGGTQNDGGPPNRSKTNEKTWTQLFLSPLRQLTAHTSAEVPSLFRDIENAIAAGHCAAGFFTYECGNCFEPKAATYPSRADQPLAWFGVYERSYAFDHSTGAFVDGIPPELTDLLAKTRTEDSSLPPEPPPKLTAGFALTESDYSRRIAAIHEWIRAGDVYQLNFTAPFHVKIGGEAPGGVAAH